MRYDAQRSRIKKLTDKLLDIQTTFKFDAFEIVKSDDECIDENKVYLVIKEFDINKDEKRV